MIANPTGVIEVPPPTLAAPSVPRQKVLFLDCDGVVCTARSHSAYGREGSQWFHWDPVACDAIKRACSKGVTIVVSSTWRHHRHRDELLAQMTKHDLIGHMHKSDPYTPDFTAEGKRILTGGLRDHWREAIRGDEIKDWLARHPEFNSYRILDDVPQFLPEQMPYVIMTDMDDGMSAENIRALLRWSGFLKS